MKDKQRHITENNRKQQRYIKDFLKNESRKALCSRVTNDMKFSVCDWFKKAQLALPCVSFMKHRQCRLIDIIKGQVSLIYEARILWSKSYTVLTKEQND